MQINISTKLANKVVEKIDVLKAKRRYICSYKDIVDEFEKKEAELLAKKESIMKSIDDAKNKGFRIIRDDVLEWLRQCKGLIEDDHTEITKACFGCIRQYRRGKQLSQKTTEIIRLISEAATFENVEKPDPRGEGCSRPIFIHFESRNLIYKQLLDALEDVDNYMTALCGMLGIGKTTLALEIGSKLFDSKKIDHVIYIDLFRYSDIKDIQQAIADRLGLLLGDKNEREGSKILRKRLTNGERILITLDHVEELINFEEIGIPSRDYHMNCRVLIISENKRLCKSMGCPSPIQLGLLSEQESWMLFQKIADINDRSDIAQEIAEECEGLPSAIVDNCILLKYFPLAYLDASPLLDSENSLIRLRGSTQFYVDSDVWLSSYEMIESKEAQKLSLILSLFPRGTKVPIEILTRFCIGLGLLEDVEKLSDARRRVLELKDILIDSFLLLEDGGHVQINGLFRKMALSQHPHEIQAIKMFDMNQKNIVATKENTIQYLYCDDLLVEDMDLFPNWFDSTKLEMLLINIEASDYVEVPKAFFKKMARLRVLFLSSNKPQLKLALQLPLSVQTLTNIRSFFLCHWKLGDISILGTLQSLGTLDLDNCSIYELSKEITRLEKLKVLSLKLCEIERNNPFEVIKGCLSLEELYFKDNKLSNINNVNEVKAINQSGTFPTLNRYHLQGDEDSISKCVCLPSIDAMISEATFKYLIRGAEILHLKEIKGGWRNLIPEIVPMEDDQSMKDVVDLSLESCSNVECLVSTKHIESTVRGVFSKLVTLKLAGMDNLKELCSGHVPSEFLKCLKTLSIKDCRNLQGILLKGELSLYNLKSLEIFDCPMLTSLFQLPTTQSLDVLEDNDHLSYDLIFPKLKTLEMERCPQLQYILPLVFPRGVPLLETIKIVDCDELKHIFGQYQQEDKDVVLGTLELSGRMSDCFNISLESISNSKSPRPVASAICLPEKSPLELNILVVRNVKKLVLAHLDRTKYLFTLSTASSMMLEFLKIESCDKLEHIIDIGDGGDRKNCYDVFPKLKELDVKSCHGLECMFGEYPQDHQNYSDIRIHLPALEKLNLDALLKFSLLLMRWPPLKEFNLYSCPNFIINNSSISDIMIHLDTRELVSKTIKDINEIDNHFCSLTNLTIKFQDVYNIFCLDRVQIRGQVRLGLQYLKLYYVRKMSYICVGSRNSFIFQNLKTIIIEDCYNLKVIFPACVVSCLPELEHLQIRGCDELKQIIDEEVEDTKLAQLDSPQPCFPKLAVLFIVYCPKLKSLISASYDVPKLELPKLKLVILSELQSLCQEGINELQSVRHRLVHKCPKLSLTSTPTLQEIEQKMHEYQRGKLWFTDDLLDKAKEIIQSHAISTTEHTQVRTMLGFDLPSSQSEIKLTQSETYTDDDKENEGPPMNIADLRDDDLISSFQTVEEDNLVVKVLADLEKYLKMPLKNLTSSKANSLGLLTALNFLSHLPPEDVSLSNELKEIIHSLHKEFLSIFYSFKQAFATANKFAVLEETEKSIQGEPTRQSLDSEISKAEKFIDEAEQKEAILKKQIHRLEKEIQVLHNIKRGVEEGTTSNNPIIETSSTHPQSASSQFGTLVASQPKSNPQSEIGLKQVLADLNESLKMPLKDIASSEANTLRLLTDLNYYLSRLPLEDVALPDGFKAIIDSLHQEFPTILCSFKQAFATTNKFAVLEPHLNEAATMSVSKISKANTFTGDDQQKEANFKENIIRLEKTITDLPIGLEAHTMSQSGVPSSQINEESEKDLAREVPDSEIHVPATTTTFPTDLKQIESPAPTPLNNTLNQTHLHEMVDGRSMSESCLIHQQKPIGETESTMKVPQGDIKHNQFEIPTDKDSKAHPKNIQDFGDEDLVKSFPAVEKDGDGQIHMTSASDVTADNLVKVLTDLKESLKIPLKDIACTEANSLRLLVALNFLSNFTLEDVTLTDGLKAIIVSMHKEPESILSSFKQVFATINKFAVLEPYLNEVATMLVPKVSTANNFMDKAQQKEETLKEQISRLLKEIKDHETELSSIQEEKKKCIAEIKKYKEENYNVNKDKSNMLEDQRKTQQELLKVHYGWSALCSQFELNRIAATNPS